MDFTNDKYIATLEKAQRYLARAKSCCSCAHAEEKIDRDMVKVCTYCTKYHKDVTRKNGSFCAEYITKGE